MASSLRPSPLWDENEDRVADKVRRDLGVYVADGDKKVAAGSDDIVAVEVPDFEIAEVPAEPPTAEAAPPRMLSK